MVPHHTVSCRKAIEGLVALSEDGCSPISIQQMAYGECSTGKKRLGLLGSGRCLGWEGL